MQGEECCSEVGGRDEVIVWEYDGVIGEEVLEDVEKGVQQEWSR